MTDAMLVLTTLPNSDVAAEMAKKVVGERLAACANILPALRSIYRWQGKLQDENEVLLLLARLEQHQHFVLVLQFPLPAVDRSQRRQGKLQDENEVLVLLKTRQQQFERLKERILELHPYDVPEVIAIPVEQGHEAYLDWIASETG